MQACIQPKGRWQTGLDVGILFLRKPNCNLNNKFQIKHYLEKNFQILILESITKIFEINRTKIIDNGIVCNMVFL